MTEITQNDLFGGVTVCTITKDPITSGLEQMEDKAYKRFCEKHYALISKLDDIGLPEPGQQIRLVTRRTFNSIQFIGSSLLHMGDRVKIRHKSQI